MHTIHGKSTLLTRVRRIQGQASALERLLEEETEPGKVLQQAAAVRGAVNGLMVALIEGHLTEHLVEEPNHDRRHADLGPVLQVIKSYLK
jgi:DNA-binding FrmR family transcriptional regulator